MRMKMDRDASFSVAVLVMGASGIIAQLLLLRELLITFLSNELSIGIILANWLVLEAAGSGLFGRSIERAERKMVLFVAVTILFSLALPPSLYLARTWKTLAGAVPGQGMGLHQIFFASFLILLPVSLTHGALFTFACRIQSGLSGRGAAGGIGRIYVLETIGTLAGGIIFTFLLITHLNSFEASLAVSLVNILCCVTLLWERPATTVRSLPERLFLGLSILLLPVAAIALFGPLPERLHRLSIDVQWTGQKVVHYQNSVYGNTAVIEGEGEYTFFSNGIPAITSPTPDVIFVEEFSNLPLLHHPRPGKVLVVSGGAGGVLSEILKHPVESVDYTELDPLVLKLVEKFPTEMTQAELGDPRVRVHFRDGRLFLKETEGSYDVVLVGLSDPMDLQINRFFTREFFSLVAARLEDGGIAAFTLPGSLTYLGPEIRDLNACIINTLSDVFPSLRVIPGDGYNILLASPSDHAFCDTGCLEKRFGERSLETSFLNPFHIRYRLDPRWSDWFSDSMAGATESRNEDFRPLAVHFSLSHWNAKFAPRLQRLLARSGEVNLAILIGAVAVTVATLLLLTGMMKNPIRMSIPFAIVSTGFAGMIFDLVLMFTFQALYGVVFTWIGLLVTAFMAGTAAGSFAMTRLMERVGRDAAWFMTIEAALVVFALLLPAVLFGLAPLLERPGLLTGVHLLFPALSFISGLLIGSQFPLAGKMYLKTSPDVGPTAGLLYGADLMGGWIGGIAGGVVLFPVLGLFETCAVLAVLKLASLVLVAAGSVPARGVR